LFRFLTHPHLHTHTTTLHLPQGLGVKRRSVNRAFMYFYTAAQAGHSQAMYNTAMMQLAGRGTQRSCRPAARLLKQLAEKGLVAVALQQGHEHFFRGQYAQVSA
jgi:SEL1 protein